MAITANKKFWTEFIDIYRSLPSLWNTKDENYNNRERRLLAWNKLVEKLQEVEPNASQESVKRKINTFRSNFNREVRKIRQTKKEVPSETYNPTLWYFDHLAFLLNQEKFMNGVCTDGRYVEELTLLGSATAKSEIIENEAMETETVIEEDVSDNNSQEEKQKRNCSTLSVKSNDSINITLDAEMLHKEPTSSVNESLTVLRTFASPADHGSHVDLDNSLESQKVAGARSICSKRSKLRFKSQDLYNRQYFKHNLPSSVLTDEAAVYGQAWAYGFRKLSPQQKLFAKKAIDEILILGQLEALKLKTVPVNINLLEDTTSDQS